MSKGATIADLDFCKQYSARVAAGDSLEMMQAKIVDGDGKPVYTTGASIAARVSKLRKQLEKKREEIPVEQVEKRKKAANFIAQFLPEMKRGRSSSGSLESLFDEMLADDEKELLAE